MVVSVYSPQRSARFREKLGAPYTFLSDSEGRLLDTLNIRNPRGGPRRADIAIPTTFLVDERGVVRWIYRANSYRVRARPEEIRRAIDMLPQFAGAF